MRKIEICAAALLAICMLSGCGAASSAATSGAASEVVEPAASSEVEATSEPATEVETEETEESEETEEQTATLTGESVAPGTIREIPSNVDINSVPMAAGEILKQDDSADAMDSNGSDVPAEIRVIFYNDDGSVTVKLPSTIHSALLGTDYLSPYGGGAIRCSKPDDGHDYVEGATYLTYEAVGGDWNFTFDDFLGTSTAECRVTPEHYDEIDAELNDGYTKYNRPDGYIRDDGAVWLVQRTGVAVWDTKESHDAYLEYNTTVTTLNQSPPRHESVVLDS